MTMRQEINDAPCGIGAAVVDEEDLAVRGNFSVVDKAGDFPEK